jgi:mannose-6-phosphate isomerase-like protein (cupin superfamily)
MDFFPGATAVSRLRVYDWPTVDGLRGGAPHLHTVCTEAYVVLAGTGLLQTLSRAGYAEHSLAPGTVLWFTPGTVHRLVITGDELEILVVMQNAGLPEAGDAVLTFPTKVLADPDRYAREAALAPLQPGAGDEREAACARAARRRRDLATEGFLTLRERVDRDGPQALDKLYEAAVVLVGGRVDRWRAQWRERALAQAQRTGALLERLAAGDAGHLRAAAVCEAEPTPPPLGFGMCGRLQTWSLARGSRPAG